MVNPRDKSSDLRDIWTIEKTKLENSMELIKDKVEESLFDLGTKNIKRVGPRLLEGSIQKINDETNKTIEGIKELIERMSVWDSKITLICSSTEPPFPSINNLKKEWNETHIKKLREINNLIKDQEKKSKSMDVNNTYNMETMAFIKLSDESDKIANDYHNHYYKIKNYISKIDINLIKETCFDESFWKLAAPWPPWADEWVISSSDEEEGGDEGAEEQAQGEESSMSSSGADERSGPSQGKGYVLDIFSEYISKYTGEWSGEEELSEDNKERTRTLFHAHFCMFFVEEIYRKLTINKKVEHISNYHYDINGYLRYFWYGEEKKSKVGVWKGRTPISDTAFPPELKHEVKEFGKKTYNSPGHILLTPTDHNNITDFRKYLFNYWIFKNFEGGDEDGGDDGEDDGEWYKKLTNNLGERPWNDKKVRESFFNDKEIPHENIAEILKWKNDGSVESGKEEEYVKIIENSIKHNKFGNNASTLKFYEVNNDKGNPKLFKDLHTAGKRCCNIPNILDAAPTCPKCWQEKYGAKPWCSEVQELIINVKEDTSTEDKLKLEYNTKRKKVNPASFKQNDIDINFEMGRFKTGTNSFNKGICGWNNDHKTDHCLSKRNVLNFVFNQFSMGEGNSGMERLQNFIEICKNASEPSDKDKINKKLHKIIEFFLLKTIGDLGQELFSTAFIDDANYSVSYVGNDWISYIRFLLLNMSLKNPPKKEWSGAFLGNTKNNYHIVYYLDPSGGTRGGGVHNGKSNKKLKKRKTRRIKNRGGYSKKKKSRTSKGITRNYTKNKLRRSKKKNKKTGKYSRNKKRSKTSIKKRLSRRKKINKSKLPMLSPLNYKNNIYKYKLNDTKAKRRKAIDSAIQKEGNKGKQSLKKSALSKKRRLNVLRIYRKNNKPKECKILTEDMEYIDKKYNIGKTSIIC